MKKGQLIRFAVLNGVYVFGVIAFLKDLWAAILTANSGG